ncbi:MAG: hypothetical protein SGBAC_006154 [Bacillariaceae sp.]
MFWIEESPTSAGDDDSDVPFDESPGKPMACEQEIELVIRPDDDHLYPSKAMDADEDTWPETLSAYGGTTSTLVSDEAEKDSNSIANIKDSSDAQVASDQNEAEGDAEDTHSVASEPTDDDATQIMGEHHTIEGPEDERTFTSAQDASFVYLATKMPAEPLETLPTSESSESAPEYRAESSVTRSNDISSSEERFDDVKETCIATASFMEAAGNQQQQEQQQESGTTLDPVVVVEDDYVSDAPGLVSESVDEDDAENDSASTSSSQMRPLNEMNDEETDTSSESDWYDQWEALEETQDDGISCISNMFASIKSSSTPPTAEDMMEILVPMPSSILANPTMTTVFSDCAESHFAKCANTMTSEHRLQQQLQEQDDPFGTAISQEEDSTVAIAAAVARKRVVLIFDGGEDDSQSANTDTEPMTLTEFLNASCMQGSRQERRRRMERQRNALRITPVITSSSFAPGGSGSNATGGGPGFFEQILEFDPLTELQNLFGLAD